jgi:hypothetical protein
MERGVVDAAGAERPPPGRAVALDVERVAPVQDADRPVPGAAPQLCGTGAHEAARGGNAAPAG